MKIIGHRGARGLAPENTLRSLQKALEHHVDEIEFDVRVTKDGVPVLHHDADINTGDSGMRIRESKYAALKTVDPDLLTLADAMAFISSKMVLLIEVKPDEATQPVADILMSAIKKGYKAETVLLGSFSQQTLRELHRELPEIQKVVIERWSGVKAVWRARQLGTKRLNMKALWLWSGFLRPMHTRGWQIAPYTVNDPAKVRKWQPYLFGVITDYPDRFENL